MQLVKVDPISIESPQARFDRVHNVAPRRTLELAGIVHRQAELGCEHDVLALGAEDSPEPLFRAALGAIAVGGIDQIDAEVDRLVHDTAGRREIDAAAEIIAAETDDGYLERRAAEPAFSYCTQFRIILPLQ